jgi:hypothetical protein
MLSHMAVMELRNASNARKRPVTSGVDSVLVEDTWHSVSYGELLQLEGR